MNFARQADRMSARGIRESNRAMTAKDFMNRLANGKEDVLRDFLAHLEQRKIAYCAVGGLAVNAYAEPVVSLDLDVVVEAARLHTLLPQLREYCTVEEHAHSVNLGFRASDLRIQIQTDPRYQEFLSRAVPKVVLGYAMPVAAMEDVIQGKVWAALDESLRPSKRQKDLADILRLVEAKPALAALLPAPLRKKLFARG